MTELGKPRRRFSFAQRAWIGAIAICVGTYGLILGIAARLVGWI